MKNQVNTSEGNVQFIDATGKMINIHPQHVYAVFNVDTVSFVMVGIPKTSGLSILTSTAEDMLFNGEEYTFEELKTVIPEEFAEAGAQARCEIVDELPETGKTNTIYLVPKTEGEGYDEYIYLKDEERWELVGDTSIEMENYLKKVDFAAYSAATDAKIDAISGAVSDEASRAISAESALSDSIDALEDYVDEVSGITDTLDGDIDILEESLAQEASARTDADTVLSGAISSVTEDVAALSGDVTAHTSNTDIHVTAADKTAWADKYTQAEVDGIVSALNDSIDAVSGAVADESARAQSAETALHDEIENIDLSDYYTKSETSGATELATAFSGKLDTTAYTPTDLTNYYTKSETSGATELSTAFAAKAELSALTEDERVWAEALTDINGKIGTISGDVDTIEAVLPNKANGSDVYLKSETSGATELDAAFSGYVTTDTEQTISGRKIFTYSSDSSKAIEFKQTSDSSKLGFTLRNSADTNNEVASFEFRPNTITIDGVRRPLMYFGHFRNANTAAAGVQQTVIGFRQSDQANQASYHFLMPLPEKAKTPFSLKTSFKDFYAPLGFKVNTGGTMVSADETGVVDLSSYISGGGSSYTAGSGIDITNDVISVTGKVDTSDFNTYSGAVESRLAEDEEVTAAAFVALNDRVGSAETAINGKQNLLTAGENIVISGDVISAEAGNDVTELTQAEYDVLVQAGTVDPDVLYIITDAAPINLNNYYTSAQTVSAITEATSGKANSSDVYTKSETSGATELATAFSGLTDRIGEDEEVTAAAFIALNDRVGSAETAINDKADISAVTAVQDSLSGYTTTGETSALSGSVTAHTSDSTIHVTSANKTSWDGAATNASTAITNLGGLKLQQVTQAEYDALVSGGTVDASTLYVIVN